jgi:hypothetical protein
MCPSCLHFDRIVFVFSFSGLCVFDFSFSFQHCTDLRIISAKHFAFVRSAMACLCCFWWPRSPSPPERVVYSPETASVSIATLRNGRSNVNLFRLTRDKRSRARRCLFSERNFVCCAPEVTPDALNSPVVGRRRSPIRRKVVKNLILFFVYLAATILVGILCFFLFRFQVATWMSVAEP